MYRGRGRVELFASPKRVHGVRVADALLQIAKVHWAGDVDETAATRVILSWKNLSSGSVLLTKRPASFEPSFKHCQDPPLCVLSVCSGTFAC